MALDAAVDVHDQALQRSGRQLSQLLLQVVVALASCSEPCTHPGLKAGLQAKCRTSVTLQKAAGSASGKLGCWLKTRTYTPATASSPCDKEVRIKA